MDRRHLLFVSGVSVGGAFESTVELAARLAADFDVEVVAQADEHSRIEQFVISAYAKARPAALQRLIGRMGTNRIGAPNSGSASAVRCARSVVAAAAHRIRRGRVDVVIANSLGRIPMRWLHETCRRYRVPLVLYMREEHSATHLSVSGLSFDAIVANSEMLKAQAAGYGHEASMIPSILLAERFHTARDVVMLINPVADNRPEILAALAARRPDDHFVLQESWPLAPEDVAAISRLASTHSNLTLRRRTSDKAQLYSDVRVLIASYPSGRPRVVLEAQTSGIPVVALRQPALIESVGDGGLYVDDATDIGAWAACLRELDDPDTYERLCDTAVRHASRPSADPDHNTRLMASLLDELITQHPTRP